MDKTRLATGLVFVAAIGSGIVAGVFAFSPFAQVHAPLSEPVDTVAVTQPSQPQDSTTSS